MIVPEPMPKHAVRQIAGCAEAITLRDITDADRSMGIDGEVQIVLRFPGSAELRVPVTFAALAAAGLHPSSA